MRRRRISSVGEKKHEFQENQDVGANDGLLWASAPDVDGSAPAWFTARLQRAA
jgi:hypothetical protein